MTNEMSAMTIACVQFSLEQMEVGKNPITAMPQLQQRLGELADGRQVPLVTFNCLETSWRPNRRRYPQTVVSASVDTAICRYNADTIDIVALELEQVGTPDVTVVVPDSELKDDRVFSFAQSLDERTSIAESFRLQLAEGLATLCCRKSNVSLWTEYCIRQGLRTTPSDYTTGNYERIMREPKLLRKVRDQVKDSRRYFERNGLDPKYLESISPAEVLERTAWYLAMYMGEGQALKESGAIVLNLEDGRVPAWFQRGANNELPILTPVDSTEFYNWREGKRDGQG